MKKRFGIKSTDAVTQFSQQWLEGEKTLENYFKKIGTTVETDVKVLSFKVPRKEGYVLKKQPKVFAKLYNSSGDQISDNCKLLISVQKVTQELSQEVGVYKEYFSYSDLDIADQNNSKFDSAVRFEMKKEGLFPAESELQILVYSPINDNIDWSKSKFSIGEIGSTDLQRGDM